MTKIILVGGFLGAGKTTLLSAMAKMMTTEGKKVGLITNDQAAALVDTVLLEKMGTSKDNVAEVSGSCFCCNFSGFQQAVAHLENNLGAEVIIAEPVGSIGNITGKQETLQMRGSVGKVDTVSLTVNARVEMTPDALQAIVLDEIAKACKNGINAKEIAFKCLQPGRPNPTYRFEAVV